MSKLSLTFVALAACAVAETTIAAPIDANSDWMDDTNCSVQCIEVFATKAVVSVWLRNNNKRQKIAQYQPDWSKSNVAAPGDQLQRYSYAVGGESSLDKSHSCGIDGWGYNAGQSISVTQLPGGGWVTITYTGYGSALAVTEYAGGGGDTETVTVAHNSGADTADCAAMREVAMGLIRE